MLRRKFSSSNTKFTSSVSVSSLRFCSSSSSSRQSNKHDSDDLARSEQKTESTYNSYNSTSLISNDENNSNNTVTNSNNNNQQHQMLDPNTAYLHRYARQGIDNKRISPQAAEYMMRLHGKLGDKINPVVEKMQDAIGDQDPKKMTPHQRTQYASMLAFEANSIFSKHQAAMFNEHQGMKDFAEKGKPTGENYWFEAGGSLTSCDMPREMKDDLFEEMKRNRPDGSAATKDTEF